MDEGEHLLQNSALRVLKTVGPQDKQAVEQYKSDIKAKLTRAGLIRGQPRTSLAAARSSTTRSNSFTRLSSSQRDTSPSANTLGLDLNLGAFNYSFDQSMNGLGGKAYRGDLYHCIDGDATGPSHNFHQLPGASYSDSNLASMDFGGGPMFQYSPQSSSVHSEPNMLDFDMNLFAAAHNSEGFDFAVRPPSPVNHFPLLAGQTSIQESHVMYFFEHVRKTNFRLTGNTLTNVTYSVSLSTSFLWTY